MKQPILRLLPARHKRAALGHPWVYSNELAADPALKTLPVGGIVRFQAHDGTFLGIGSYNPHSLIAGRIFSRAPLATLDSSWFAERFEKAAALRDRLVGAPYYRLIHAEADGLPGLVIDRFGPHFSVQMNCAGMDLLGGEIEKALNEVFEPESIVLHNDSSVRKLEGLGQEVRLAKGEPQQGPIEVQENGLVYYADLLEGQKTGWYYDQRDNHALVALFADGQSVLDLYCHAGGFGLLAARGGARQVVGVDASQRALDLAAKAAEANGFDDRCTWIKADVFEDLEARIAAKERYDIVIADPPPFVKSRKDIASGARGYRKLTRLSAGVTAQGGLLFIASCSHNMTLTLLAEEVAKGLSEAKRQGRILYTVFAAPDHPVHPHVPESAYLKGFLLKLDEL